MGQVKTKSNIENNNNVNFVKEKENINYVNPSKSILENVKSKYILKKIFSYLDVMTKLKIIKYNKSLQNKINIRLIHYKGFSGGYIKFKKTGFGEEIIDNYLIYEGQYLDGKKNGKGKEYNKMGKIKFEGEYLNGKRNGKGKEFDIKHKLIFEGEYLNGKRWNGMIKLYMN